MKITKKALSMMCAGVCTAGIVFSAVSFSAFAEDDVKKVNDISENSDAEKAAGEDDPLIKQQEEGDQGTDSKVDNTQTDGNTDDKDDGTIAVKINNLAGSLSYDNDADLYEVYDSESDTYLLTKGKSYTINTVDQSDKNILVGEIAFTISKEGQIQITKDGGADVSVNGTEIAITPKKKERRPAGISYPVTFIAFDVTDGNDIIGRYLNKKLEPCYNANFTIDFLPYVEVYKNAGGYVDYDGISLDEYDYEKLVSDNTYETVGSYSINKSTGNSIEIPLANGMYRVNTDLYVGEDVGSDINYFVVMDGEVHQIKRKGYSMKQAV